MSQNSAFFVSNLLAPCEGPQNNKKNNKIVSTVCDVIHNDMMIWYIQENISNIKTWTFRILAFKLNLMKNQGKGPDSRSTEEKENGKWQLTVFILFYFIKLILLKQNLK